MSFEIGKISRPLPAVNRNVVFSNCSPQVIRNSKPLVPPYHNIGFSNVLLENIIQLFKRITESSKAVWSRSIWSSSQIPREAKARMLSFDHYPRASWD